MSMFRRRTPSDAGHEQHDTLLVAQYAARDPLDQEQLREAGELVGRCGECASLAADLGVIARAVATEPMPRRQRDFTISPEQAAQLRGSPLSRFMRRLALPQSRALRPLAAGVMSLGLVLVVAGNVIPGAEQASGVVPASGGAGESDFFAAPTLETNVESELGGILETPEGGAGVESPVGGESELGAALSERSRLPQGATDADLVVGADGEEAPDAPGAAKAVGRRAQPGIETPAVADDAAASGLLEVAAGEPQANSAAVDERDDLGASAPTSGDAADGFADSPAKADPLFRTEKRSEALESRVNEVEATPDDERDDVVPESLVDAVVPGSSEQERAASTQNVAATDSVSTIDVMVVVGIVLAVSGFFLLLLIWVARRGNPDPLAP